jgi:hypothetical protein
MRGPNVILITFDGVRPEEFFSGSSHGDINDEIFFPHLWPLLESSGVIFGSSESNPLLASHPSLTSLPCYRTILSGEVHKSSDNDTTPMELETVFDSLGSRIQQPNSMALFSSWEKLRYAVSDNPQLVLDSGFSGCPKLMGESWYSELLAKAIASPPPWPECRKDSLTWATASEFRRRYSPRFMYISLADADDLAHLGDRRGYDDSLRAYDCWLWDLCCDLRREGDATVVILSTDHGRGNGSQWTEHGPGIKHAEDIWLVAFGFGVQLQVQTGRRDQLAIRPTIENLLGIEHPKSKLLFSRVEA